MSLHVFGSNTFSGSNGLLSNVSGIRRQQVSRLNAYVRGKRASPKQARALRKAQYKEKLATSNLPKDVRISLAANPLQLGAPRCFKVLLAGKDVVVDAKLHDKSRFVDEGHHIHFAQFGIPGKGVRLNHEWINPDHITVSANHRVYTLKTQDGDGNPFNMHIDFTQLSRPVGHIETADGYLAMTLEPYALSFNVNVSANAGAGYDSATNTLTWDENSTQWKAANWEQNSMIFSYDTVAVKSPFGSPILINEVSFEDTKTARNGKTMPACVTTIKPAFVMSPPTVRTSDTIKSVFPQDSIFQFDELGVNFTGAYRITQDGSTPPVYAVVGTGVMPVNQVTTREATNKSRSLFETKITPYPRIFSMSRNDISSSLPITGLLNNDPMSPSTTDPTGYVDTVSQTANQDFHDIVCYYMDPDIHTTFISATPTVLSDSTVQAIATDSPDNAAFYKTLQVPYVTSILGNSTLPEGKQCNAVRSNAQLRELPANSPIYQRQSDALYRHRFLQLFPAIQSYLDDQANTDYAALIASAGATMAADIKAKAAGIVPSNPQDVKAAADALTSALADLQSLQDWATSQKLFYAFELYWYCENYFLPVLIAQSADGSLSASVARTMKKLTLIFGVLENGQQNPNGKSFTEAFNDLVRLFQMSSIIPQFVDPNTTSGDLDSLEKEMLQQFYHDNISSSDPNVVQEAQNAQQLAADDTLRRNFFNSLATSMAFGGSLGSWATIAQLNQEFLDAAGWYKKLVNAAGLTSTFLRTSCIAFMIMPMLNAFGGWGGMSATQKATWAITAADLGLTFLVKTIQGALRLYYFWDDLGSFAPRLKALFGFGKFVENLPDAAAETQNIFAQWFIRGNRELRDMGGEGLLEAQEVTTGMKIFGRSAGEFLTNCVGAVLAGVNIVMSAINLAKTSDPLEKAMDSLMIASGGLQLLAIGANWAVTAEIVTSDLAVSIFETVAAVAGPLAIAAAFAGLVIVIVMAFTDSTPPNPVQDFVDKYAEPAGLKMDFDTAIDYLNVVPPDSSATSLNGISFEAQLTGSSSPSAIQLGVQVGTAPAEFSIQPGASITYLPDTCWNVSTDYQGITTIYTYYMDVNNNQQPLCLAETSDGSLQALPPPAKTTKDAQGNDVPVDPSVYQQAVSMQQWTFTTKSAPQTTTRTIGSSTTTYVTSAQFVATRNNKFLTLKKQSDGTSIIDLDTVDNSGNPNSDPMRAVVWTLTLQSMSPSDFSYLQQNWQLNTNQTDEQNSVTFSGATSDPLSWSITPALPSFLTLGSTDGTICQVSGVKPAVTPATEFTVTASINILGKTYSKTAEVTISVVDPSAGSAALTALLETINGDGGVITSGFAATPKENGFKARATFTQASSTPAANGGLAQSLRRNVSLQDDAVDFEKLQENYAVFLQSAPGLFLWQQPQPVQLNQHYTATAAIDKMQNSLTGSWDRMTSPFTSDNISYESIYFPSPAACPPPGTNDPLDYHGAAEAFVVQSIYNGDGYAQQYIDLNATYPSTNTFNNLLWSTNTQRYLDWLSSPSGVSTIPPPCSLADYQSCLTNADWVGYHRALQASGGWANQSYEMYFHFLKLCSLGATPPVMASLFTSITGPDGLDPSGFSDITPTTWTAYTGYLLTGPIESAQLNVTGMGQTSQYAVPVEEMYTVISQHADTSFVREAGYWQSPPSGCCFAVGTAVVLDDGSNLAIENILPGMKVKSVTNAGEDTHRVVKCVSKPKRDGRALYSFRKDIRSVRFTATHPILLGYDDSTSRPVLGFVDVASALMANPLWAAFELETLSRDDLVQHTSSNEEKAEVLYDLVLEGSTQNGLMEVATFTICQGVSDKTLNVCSEAPDVCAMPAMSRFVLAILEAIGPHQATITFFPDGLKSGAVDWLRRILKHRQAAATFTSESPVGWTYGPVDMDSALSVVQGSINDAQVLMDTAEAISSALGWRLQCHLENGWQFLPSSAGSENRRMILCLSTHHLTLVQIPLLQIPACLETAARAAITTLRRILLRSSNLSATISILTFDHKSVLTARNLKCRSAGSNVHHLHSTIPVVDLNGNEQSTAWTHRYKISLSMDEGSVVLEAEGGVVPDVPAMWPLYLRHSESNRMTEMMTHWHVGWISVTGAIVPETSLGSACTWALKTEIYAERLGGLIGKDLMETVLGAKVV